MVLFKHGRFARAWLPLLGAVAMFVTVLTLPAFTQGGGQAPAPAQPEGGRGGRGGGREGGGGGREGAGGRAAGAPAQAGRGGGRAAGGPALADPINRAGDYGPKDPVRPLTPAEQLKTFILPPGWTMELVLADPTVVAPAAIAFDGNGKMYVAEIRSYMMDADATRQQDPISRISLHESTRGDGVFDKHTVFADNLIFPRAVTPLHTSVLINETYSDDLVELRDTNGDGVSDTKSVFFSGIGTGRSGNVQQAQSGFLWGMDNWIYSTYNAFRFRWTPKGVVRETTGAPGAEWGMSIDDDGKIWLVNAAQENGPTNFQFPYTYGSFNLPTYQWMPDADGIAFNITTLPQNVGDMQGGLNRVRMPLGSMSHFTSTTGPEVVRSDRYPADFNGDLLFTDPVGRMIRRAKIIKEEGLTKVQNAYVGNEFIMSTDPLFRPVNIKTGPDGAIYIVDMYHGIIQDHNWTARGTYLRYKIEQYGLDKINSSGRIWRLKYTGVPASSAALSPTNQPAIPAIELNTTWPKMNDETPAQLVAHLSHPIGWWRDTAQRLLVLKQDKSVVPALTQLASNASGNLMGRFHALWTLEGLGSLNPSMVRELMKDANPRMKIQAIRASESLFKAGDRSFEADYRAAARDADADVIIQAMLTLKLFRAPDLAAVVTAASAANPARGIREIGTFVTAPPPAIAGAAGLSPEEAKLIADGDAAYKSVCFNCHGEDGLGRLKEGANGAMMAPAVAGNPRVNGHRDYVVKILLKGMVGPMNGETFSEVMVPMGANTDAWIAAVASYTRSAFGNAGGVVSPADVARVRAATANRRTPWTLTDVTATVPKRLENQSAWKVTASHNPAELGFSLTSRGWSTGAPQAPGMYYQIELPQPLMLAEIEFDSPIPTTGRLGGRGAAGPPPMFPRGYKVEVSLNGTTWGPRPVAEGKGNGPRTTVTFAPVRARFVRITQTDPTPDPPANWSIGNVKLYEQPATGR
jgi:mono/diheme cytochrome c family protein